MTQNNPSPSDGELDELLDGRTIEDETTQSKPQRTEDPSGTPESSDNRPLPLTIVTQTKNHRQLLDYFLTADIPKEGYNKTKIAEESGVTTNGIRRHIGTFLEFGVVELTTSEDAHIKKYTTDKDSDVHRILRTANNVLAEEYVEQS